MTPAAQMHTTSQPRGVRYRITFAMSSPPFQGFTAPIAIAKHWARNAAAMTAPQLPANISIALLIF